jgi:hypothetical protein
MMPGRFILRRFASDQAALESFVDELNRPKKGSRFRLTLDPLIRDWFELGKNSGKFFAKHPYMERIPITGLLHGLDSPQAGVIFTSRPGPNRRKFAANELFLNFLLNPRNEYFGGPCPECKRYFTCTTKRKKRVFCDQKCGKKTSSRLAAANTRERDRQEKLQKLRDAIGSAKFAPDWKQRISKNEDVKLAFITRAVNAGEIVAPR